MLDVKFIRENPEKVKKGLKNRGLDPNVADRFLKLDEEWRKLTMGVDELRSKQKKLSKERKISEAKKLKKKLVILEEKLKKAENERNKLLGDIPNIPAEDAPVGGEDAAVVVRSGGKKPNFKFKAQDHLTLGEQLDIIDVKHAAEAAGSRFSYLKGGAALLELGLIQYAFEQLVKEGFEPVFPPAMIKPEMMRAMGKGKFVDDEEAFHLEKDNLYLIGSAEHTLGLLGKDHIFNLRDLPRKYAGFSTSFRREAGSYGKDTKGILRVHQFDKIEQFIFCRSENSEKELKGLVAMQEKLMKGLKLPYRIVEIATGDMTWGDYHQFDIEAWLPSHGVYREMGSASNTTDFQARGINARYRDEKNQLRFTHMLNATGLAVGRTIIAIIENYQTAKGTVKVPRVLQKYMFGVTEIK
ncbi:MAG: serine--tRNA ligase [Patescibacteria group bacterium]